MRLFAAFVPPRPVTESLALELARHRPGARGDRGGLRWVDPALWHVTVAFYGRDDPDRRTEWLRDRLAGYAAPRLRLEGAGTFPGVLWTGVTGDSERLRSVAVRAGTGERNRRYHAHLTLARWKGAAAAAHAEGWRRLLAGYHGPGWLAGELVLMRSDRGPDGPRYTVLERFALAGT
ncbi:2'-5' RNA ligase [Haloechinothrix alba]|uniref:RNA 2',3'-cyclic phosphodiesterase n=1 Tax=Haloechinothrix alba TaxID=664784 RepID=A0A238WF93_9PSEU|nr:RNA 2',3'-cyclic phosphodiesterase [Haloechinothrix alba]SNR44953.1 2'-5' RNA ligase [Haloechinothrix alba]